MSDDAITKNSATDTLRRFIQSGYCPIEVGQAFALLVALPAYDADEYQRQAARTLPNSPRRPLTDDEIMLVWCALGLAGEAGEVAERIKKVVFHEHPMDKALIEKEIGDAQWYIAGLMTRLQGTMSAMMRLNIDKLMKRYPDGFKPEDSINRKE